jgi:hypothetical protein
MAYMLFAFDNYYPGGGMNDHVATFTDMEDFYRWKVSADCDRFQIFDTYNGNKSTLDMYRKINQMDDVLTMELEDSLKQKYLEQFVSDFINGV